MRLVVPLLALLLSGCGSAGQEQAQWRANDVSRCQDFGFTPGTDNYANCLMHLDTARRRMLVEWAKGWGT